MHIPREQQAGSRLSLSDEWMKEGSGGEEEDTRRTRVSTSWSLPHTLRYRHRRRQQPSPTELKNNIDELSLFLILLPPSRATETVCDGKDESREEGLWFEVNALIEIESSEVVNKQYYKNLIKL